MSKISIPYSKIRFYVTKLITDIKWKKWVFGEIGHLFSDHENKWFTADFLQLQSFKKYIAQYQLFLFNSFVERHLSGSKSFLISMLFNMLLKMYQIKPRFWNYQIWKVIRQYTGTFNTKIMPPSYFIPFSLIKHHVWFFTIFLPFYSFK